MRRRRVSRVLGGLAALWLVGVLAALASAGQVLDWKSVPRESVGRFERMRVVRHSPAPDPTDTLSFDRTPAESPEPPEPPEPPDPVETSGGIMKIGSDIHVGPGEVVHGDLSAVSGDITIEGHVEGDVVAMRGDVDLKSTARVDGDVVCLGGTLTEEPGAQVGGQKVTAPGSGSWSVSDPERHRDREHDHIAGALVWLLLLTLFGWVFVRFAPGRTVAATQTMSRSPGLSLGLGSLVWALIIPSLIALSLVVALLCITIIGIPLALAALVGYAVFLGVLGVWGFIVGATVLGGGLSRSTHRHPVAAAPAAQESAAAAPPAPTVVSTPAQSLMRSMLIGVGVLMGSIVFGRLLQVADLGPLHGFGTLILVLGIVASSVATTIGAGALLRSEIVTGTFQRLWSGRRFGQGARGGQAAPSAAPAPATGAVAPPPASWPQPAPPPPPSPPTSFMPPTETPEPPPAT